MEHDREAELEALARSIAEQSDALAHLRFKFEVQQLMLSGGRAAWIDETTRELEAAIAGVHKADVAFRHHLFLAAGSLGLPPESTLRELASALGEPWRYIFEQGRDDLRRSLEAVGRLCEENRRLLARGFLATSEALALLGVETAGLSYDATGALRRPQAAAAILNERA
jgi:hypothetical protein